MQIVFMLPLSGTKNSKKSTKNCEIILNRQLASYYNYL